MWTWPVKFVREEKAKIEKSPSRETKGTTERKTAAGNLELGGVKRRLSWLGKFPRRLGFAALAFAVGNQLQQIEEDEQIGGEQADTGDGDPAEDLEDLPGKKRGCDQQG